MKRARQESALKRRQSDIELYKSSINDINSNSKTTVKIRGLHFSKEGLQSKLAVAKADVVNLSKNLRLNTTSLEE